MEHIEEWNKNVKYKWGDNNYITLSNNTRAINIFWEKMFFANKSLLVRDICKETSLQMIAQYFFPDEAM